ncbi:hypothetical protein KCU62_g449, partial [Aureobasidium sp. EXF-3399]
MSAYQRWYYKKRDDPIWWREYLDSKRPRTKEYLDNMKRTGRYAQLKETGLANKREAFEWKTHLPVVYPERVRKTCSTCHAYHAHGARLWWQDLHDPDKFVCQICYTKNGIAAAMPKGHEDFVMGSGKWPKPYDFKQGAKSSPEPKHQIQSSTASETMRGYCCPTSIYNLPFGLRFCTTMNITSTRCSHEEYLEATYAHQKETGGRHIPLFDILKELFQDTIQPDEAATRLSSFIFLDDDVSSLYSGVLSTIIGAAQELSETGNLEKLANLVLALSRLLDVRNQSSETLHLCFNLKAHDIAPGQVLKVDDGKIWSQLPGFATDLGDCPTAYINDGVPEHIAEQQWTNQNTFAANLIHSSSDSPCSFDFLYQFAFRVIADSLEWDARTVEGMDSLHSLRAAMRWIEIAGDEVWERTRTNGGWTVAGPLWYEEWERQGSDDEGSDAHNSVTPARWLWWAKRLHELAESNMIDEEAKTMAGASAHKMREYQDESDVGSRDNDDCFLTCIVDYDVARAWLEVLQVEIVVVRVTVSGLAVVPVLPAMVGENVGG